MATCDPSMREGSGSSHLPCFVFERDDGSNGFLFVRVYLSYIVHRVYLYVFIHCTCTVQTHHAYIYLYHVCTMYYICTHIYILVRVRAMYPYLYIVQGTSYSYTVYIIVHNSRAGYGNLQNRSTGTTSLWCSTDPRSTGLSSIVCVFCMPQAPGVTLNSSLTQVIVYVLPEQQVRNEVMIFNFQG